MAVHIFSRILEPVHFNCGYVQATRSFKGVWRVTAWMERRLTSGNVYHTRAETRVRRSEEAARQTACEMATFWSNDNPEFADDKGGANHG